MVCELLHAECGAGVMLNEAVLHAACGAGVMLR